MGEFGRDLQKAFVKETGGTRELRLGHIISGDEGNPPKEWMFIEGWEDSSTLWWF